MSWRDYLDIAYGKQAPKIPIPRHESLFLVLNQTKPDLTSCCFPGLQHRFGVADRVLYRF